jgi:hypothetical protein
MEVYDVTELWSPKQTMSRINKYLGTVTKLKLLGEHKS